MTKALPGKPAPSLKVPVLYFTITDHFRLGKKRYAAGVLVETTPRNVFEQDRLALFVKKGWIRVATDADRKAATSTEEVVPKPEQTPAPATAAAAGPGQVQSVPVLKIRPDPTQPRRDFEPASMKELVDSIKVQGVEQAILVRPMSRWRQIIGFVARQWARREKKEEGWGLSIDRFWAEHIKISAGELLKGPIIERLLAEGRIQQSAVDAKLHEPTALALAPLVGETTLPSEEEWLEIVYGERRWRGAQEAGLTEIPAKVRELTDTEAAEKQAIENLDRDDLKPLEEAAQYQKLLSQPGYSIQRVMDTTGKGRSSVYAKLKLLTLPPEPLKMLAAGKLPPSTADLIASCDPAIQERVSNAILHPPKYNLPDGETVLSVSRAKQAVANIEEQHAKEQKWAAAVEKAKAEGIHILPDAEMEKWAGYSPEPSYGSPYALPSGKCWEHPQKLSFAKLLGKKGLSEITRYLGVNKSDGSGVVWIKREDAVARVKTLGIKLAASSSSSGSSAGETARKAHEAAERKKRKEQLAREDKGVEEIVHAIESMGANRLPADVWRYLAKTLAEDSCYDVARRVNKRRQTGEKTRGDAALATIAARMEASQAAGLLAEIVVYGVRGCWKVEKRMKPLRVLLGLEPAGTAAGDDAEGEAKGSPNVRTDDEEGETDADDMEDAA